MSEQRPRVDQRTLGLYLRQSGQTQLPKNLRPTKPVPCLFRSDGVVKSAMVSDKSLWNGKCISTSAASFGKFKCGEESRCIASSTANHRWLTLHCSSRDYGKHRIHHTPNERGSNFEHFELGLSRMWRKNGRPGQRVHLPRQMQDKLALGLGASIR
jgi:hypothetical protein